MPFDKLLAFYHVLDSLSIHRIAPPTKRTCSCGAPDIPAQIIPASPGELCASGTQLPVQTQELSLVTVQQGYGYIPFRQPVVHRKRIHSAPTEPDPMPDPARAGIQGDIVFAFSNPHSKQHGGNMLCHQESPVIEKVYHGAECHEIQHPLHIYSLLCMKSRWAGQAKVNSNRMDDCHEFDPLHQFLRLPV